MRRFARLTVEWWAVLAISALALALAVAFDLTARVDYALHDLIQRHDERPIDPRILIVAVDDRSLNEIGAWPWPRSSAARLVDQISKGGPKGVALDLLLLQPTTPAADADLAMAIARAGNVYLPVHFEVPGRNGAAYTLVKPLPSFAAAAAGLGHVNLRPDPDGSIRRIFLRYRDGQRNWSQLVATMAARTGADDQPIRQSGLVADEPVMIQYAQGPGGFPTISAASIIRGEVPAELLQGRLVIVGVTAAGLGDVYATPMGSNGALMPGIEIQANLLNAILTGQVMIEASLPWRLAYALVPLVMLLLVLRVFPLRWVPFIIAGMVACLLGASVALLVRAHVWMPPVTPMLGLMGLYPLWAWRRLVAVSGYISRELETLDREQDLLNRPRPDLPAADPVTRQMALLRSAIERGQDLRRFLIDRIAQMPDAVIVTDTAGQVVLANAGATHLAASLHGDARALTHADDLLGAISHVPGDGGGPIIFADHGENQQSARDCKGETQSGQTFDIRFEPQHSHAGVLVGYDIRIADTTANTVLQRQREDILQLLSHDMRSPQASIITLLDTVEAGGIGPDTLPRIRGYAQRSLKLADDFVHLSRAELMQVEPVVLDLASIAQDAADMLWPQAQARGIAITVQDDTGRDELLVRGDASLLTRALINLVDNAVKFSHAGGKVRVRLAVGEYEGRPSALAEVHDEGLGIAPEQRAVLFERFRRAPSGAAHKIGGSGLGLAFVHTVAARHFGRIACDSQLGCGTSFTLELPLAE